MVVSVTYITSSWLRLLRLDVVPGVETLYLRTWADVYKRQVVQGGELFTLASTKEVCVKLEVSANDFDNLVIGSSADIKIGQYSYQGTLKSVNKIAVLNQKGNPVIRCV